MADLLHYVVAARFVFFWTFGAANRYSRLMNCFRLSQIGWCLDSSRNYLYSPRQLPNSPLLSSPLHTTKNQTPSIIKAKPSPPPPKSNQTKSHPTPPKHKLTCLPPINPPNLSFSASSIRLPAFQTRTPTRSSNPNPNPLLKPKPSAHSDSDSNSNPYRLFQRKSRFCIRHCRICKVCTKWGEEYRYFFGVLGSFDKGRAPGHDRLKCLLLVVRYFYSLSNFAMQVAGLLLSEVPFLCFCACVEWRTIVDVM